jgi:hypothetical protein
MSNRKIDDMMLQLTTFGEVVELIVAPPITYAVVKLGQLYGVGVMKCMKEDEFDRDFGIRNALRKAVRDIIRQRELNSYMVKFDNYNLEIAYDKHDLLRDDPYLEGVTNA